MTGKIVLARNVHAGAEQAEKLEALINEANVVSFETANLPTEAVNYMERLFAHGNQSRLQEAIDFFQRSLEKEYEGVIDYEKRLYELLKKHRKEVVPIEKFSKTDLARANSHEIKNGERIREAFLVGDIDTATTLQMEDAKNAVASSCFRNEKIVEYAPEALRKAKLKAGRQNIFYLVIFGRRHTIAKNLADQTNVVVEDVLVPGSSYEHLLVSAEIRSLVFEGKDDKAAQYMPLKLMEGSLYELLSKQEQLMEFYQNVVQEQKKKIQGHTLSELLDFYVIRPLSSNIARQVSPEQVKIYASRLEKSIFEEVSRGDYQRWSSITFAFLREIGIAIPEEGKGDIEKWRALFPFGKEGSQEIVRTLHYPRAKV